LQASSINESAVSGVGDIVKVLAPAQIRCAARAVRGR
jgi:hypothetical protein